MDGKGGLKQGWGKRLRYRTLGKLGKRLGNFTSWGRAKQYRNRAWNKTKHWQVKNTGPVELDRARLGRAGQEKTNRKRRERQQQTDIQGQVQTDQTERHIQRDRGTHTNN